MPETGRILRIEKLSSFDGEGLRTVVFLKGCPLTCRWCSTPESQRSGPDFGVDRNKCTGCFACAASCPEQALAWDIKTKRFVTDFSKCTDCRSCTAACPGSARTGWGYTADTDEIFKEVQKDSLFYLHSGGGITVSGGEPLIQAAFTGELLKKCRDHGINTAIETSGHVPWQNIDRVLPHLDMLFYDLKHMDEDRHKALTGVSNQLILSNLRKIDGTGTKIPLVVRMPVVPGCNDSADNIEALGRFCSELETLARIQLLPYHRLGLETYRRMGRRYELEGLESGSAESLENHADNLRQMGLEVRMNE